jgi:hypothetical protein
MYQKQIMVWERNAVEAQDAADQLYERIASYETPSQIPAVASGVPETIEADTVIGDMTVYRYTDPEKGPAEEDSASETPENPVKGYFGNQAKDAPGVKDQTQKTGDLPVKDDVAITGRFPAVKEQEAGPSAGDASLLQSFSVSGSSPYSADNPIPVDPVMPGGAFYRIQLGVFSKPVDAGTFGGISPITAETIPDRGLIRYYAGTFNRYEEAEKALQQLQREGYNDSFIVAWYNRTKMSADRVRKLEK